MNFNQICKAIKEVKIQGAEHVAIAAVKAYSLKPTKESIKELIALRPTEPCLRNSLKLAQLDKSNIKEALDHLENSFDNVAKIASRKIENGMIIYTHCHSTTVTRTLIKAKEQGKKFKVNCTETRPLYQGRKTATELAKAKIPVTYFVDSAARLALKESDLFLIGADAITAEGKVINKIGSELFAETAYKLNVPLYVCSDSWKFDPETLFGYEEKIEKRSASEVWPKAPREVKISNYAFEKISPHLIEGIISELGDFSPQVFISEVKRAYPWMLK